MIVQMFAIGRFLTNCCIVSCKRTKEAIILDPSFDNSSEAERIFKYIEANTLSLKFIVNTHGHPDHTCGNGIAKTKFEAPILIHEYDAYMLGEMGKEIAEDFGFESFSPPADVLLHEGDVVKFGNVALKVMHTPGHSRGSISLLGEKEVFTGDTLFAGSIGRTDFPGSSGSDMRLSLERLKRLPNYFVVYPGHGPITTIEKEKYGNQFLR